ILPSTWYTRRRTLISFGFFVMIALTFFFQNTLTEGTFQTITNSLHFSLLNSQFDSHTTINPTATIIPTSLTASQRLVRVDSSARNQYYTAYQWQVWSYSSCSGIAMEMVMNAYGRHLIAADVLQEELNLGVWDVNLGLLREDGINSTAAYFGFNTSATHTRTLQNILAISNQGLPVIVSVRDPYYFPGGHIFVVHGGDSNNVYIADSSPHNFQRMSYSTFLAMWQGFSAVLTPR
ncbi:MAG TPA: hypothetical protein DHW02_07915, partial [Ktedonobacter sp.]|nr:hypothetical protein [Ktedonobacter sp.]